MLFQLQQNNNPGPNGNIPVLFRTQYVQYELQMNPNNMTTLQLQCQEKVT